MKSSIASRETGNRYSTIGFTLIELLVVITLLVVLLALLMPALDQAVYQAAGGWGKGSACPSSDAQSAGARRLSPSHTEGINHA